MLTMADTDTTVIVALSTDQVAKRLGMKNARSLSGIKLPPHDVEVGIHRGWFASTIDAWHAERPGRGWHGGR
jgi:hypothetical protein